MQLVQAPPGLNRRLVVKTGVLSVVVDLDNPADQRKSQLIQGQCCALFRVHITFLHNAAERMTRKAGGKVTGARTEKSLNGAAVLRDAVHRHFPHHTEILG